MNYTKVPRKLIYRDRNSLEEFVADDPYSINWELARLMRQYLFLRKKRNDYRDILLTIFNEAYYLTTLLLMDDNVLDNYYDYTTSILTQSQYPKETTKYIKGMVMALCYIYLETPTAEKPMLAIIRHYLRDSAKEFAYLDSEVSRIKHPSAKEFAPVKITKELVAAINWEVLTCDFKPERIKELLDYLGETKKEKRLLTLAMFTRLARYDSPLSSIYHTAESLLLSKYREYGGSTMDFVNIQLQNIKDNNIEVKEIYSYPSTNKLLYEQMTMKKRIQDLEKQNKLLEDSNRQLKEQLYCMQEECEQQKARVLSQKEQQHREEQLQTRINEMSKIITTMQGKVGNKAIQLKYIVESIKNKAVFVGLREAYELFETINSMLCEEPVWIENRHELQDFFKECKKNNNATQIISGDYVVNKHVDHEVANVAAGGTGILMDKIR